MRYKYKFIKKEYGGKLMSQNFLETESCYSCNKIVSPAKKGAAKFFCPQCGGMIIRCSECRRLSNGYKCPSCNFEGP